MDNLIHNIAGQLAGLFVQYLCQKGGPNSHDYYCANWKAEYKSRIDRMTKNPDLIKTFNGYNDFFKTEIKQTGDNRREFIFNR